MRLTRFLASGAALHVASGTMIRTSAANNFDGYADPLAPADGFCGGLATHCGRARQLLSRPIAGLRRVWLEPDADRGAGTVVAVAVRGARRE